MDEKFHVIIMGVQRSGTDTLLESLSFDKNFNSYNEGDSRAFDNWFLKKEKDLRELMKNPCIFKAISETGRGGDAPTDLINSTKREKIYDFFYEFSNYKLRIPWIYRNPVNVYYSWHEKWNTPLDIFLNQWNKRNKIVLNEFYNIPLTLYTFFHFASLVINPVRVFTYSDE